MTDSVQDYDVVIVGAGISGIGAAYHLHRQRPGTRFLVLDAFESFGGTWLWHKYPGIRSDSDFHTFGYHFKPWDGKLIARADEILKYLGEVIEENGLAPHMRYRHKVLGCAWSSEANDWLLTVRDEADGSERQIRTQFLWMCQGYYDHAKGYTPDWPGLADFKGQLIHPQTWPEDADLAGKTVVVIGSGATAVTLIPAIAGEAAHVTCLQRSPAYYIPKANADELAESLRELNVDPAWIHDIVRRKILLEQHKFVKRTFEEPEAVKGDLIAAVRRSLPEGFDIEKHFVPRYRPWRQRVAVAPDGDFFQALASGKADIVTDEIDRFVEGGVRLKSGGVLEADVIVTATGFNLSVMNGVDIEIDGEPVDFSQAITWRSMMFRGVPNMFWTFGYFRSAWTLRVDLISDFVCRLLDHVERKQADRVQVDLDQDDDIALLPWMDPDNFNSGYLLRSLDRLPKRADIAGWRDIPDYYVERDELPKIDLDGPEFSYA